jgi:hypothetical protein
MPKQTITSLKPGFIFIPFGAYAIQDLPAAYEVHFRGGEGVIYQLTTKDPNGACPISFEDYQSY